jgi:hypothetical protein
MNNEVVRENSKKPKRWIRDNVIAITSATVGAIVSSVLTSILATPITIIEHPPTDRRELIVIIKSTSEQKTKTDYVVDVKTSTKKHANTDEIVLLSIKGSDGYIKEFRLNDKKKNDFEQGNIDRFRIENILDLGEIEKIKLEVRDNNGDGTINGWYPEYIQIKNEANDKEWKYKLDQWLDDKKGRSTILKRS